MDMEDRPRTQRRRPTYTWPLPVPCAAATAAQKLSCKQRRVRSTGGRLYRRRTEARAASASVPFTRPAPADA